MVDVDFNTMFFSCHSVADITTKFQEFEYSAELDGIVCSVCNPEEPSLKSSVFTYESYLEQDFTGQVQSKKFGNLKAILKKHLKSLGHQKSMVEATNKANIEYKEDSRNKAVAMKIGRIAYYLLKSGRPDTDFTTLIYVPSFYQWGRCWGYQSQLQIPCTIPQTCFKKCRRSCEEVPEQ